MLYSNIHQPLLHLKTHPLNPEERRLTKIALGARRAMVRHSCSDGVIARVITVPSSSGVGDDDPGFAERG